MVNEADASEQVHQQLQQLSGQPLFSGENPILHNVGMLVCKKLCKGRTWAMLFFQVVITSMMLIDGGAGGFHNHPFPTQNVNRINLSLFYTECQQDG